MVITRVAAGLLAASLLAACGGQTQIPAGAQTVRVSTINDVLQIDPTSVAPGYAYLVFEESAQSVDFVHRSGDINNPHAPPLPLSDADIASLEQIGSFEGAGHDGFSVEGHGNVFKIGPLVEGSYALVIDRNGGSTLDPALITVAVLEVR